MQLEVLGELQLHAAPGPGRPSYLSAASGLVKVDELLYVVADDELHLGVFSARDRSPGTLLRLFEGELPQSPAGRKRHKPDLEALVALPPFAHCPAGALLALGSGSKPQRCRGVLLPLSEPGAGPGAGRGVNVAGLRVLDLADWFAGLATTLTDLNIEGAVVWQERLVLMQRGNRRSRENCLISVALPALLTAITQGVVPRMPILALEPYDLGELAGVPLGFTDGAVLPDGRLIFAAVAEDTADSYLDGPCRGAALGVIDSSGRLGSLHPLQHPYKVEGLHAEPSGTQVQLWAVTDADDASVPATLLHGVLPE